MRIGIVVGRFQVPFLHEGHLKLLKFAESESDRLLILLGCGKSVPNRREPLDFKQRESMIEEFFPNATIVPIFDNESDEVWSNNIVNTAHSLFPDMTEGTLYGGRDSCLPHFKSNRLKTEYIQDADISSGTKERWLVAKHQEFSEDFRHGCIYTTYRYRPTPIMATDIALVRVEPKDKERPGRVLVLLGRKPGEQRWRFPGGKVDVTDQSLEQCARRELEEEAGIHAEHMKYLGSFLVDDWRFRNNPDTKIITALFLAKEMTKQKEVAGDDLEEVKWFDLNELKDETITPTHQTLLITLQQNVQNDVVESEEGIYRFDWSNHFKR